MSGDVEVDGSIAMLSAIGGIVTFKVSVSDY